MMEIGAQLDASGLTCVATHIPAPRLQQEAARVAAEQTATARIPLTA